MKSIPPQIKANLRKAKINYISLTEEEKEYIQKIYDTVVRMVKEKKGYDEKTKLLEINVQNVCRELGDRRSKIYEDKFSNVLKFLKQLVKDNEPKERHSIVKIEKNKEDNEIKDVYASMSISYQTLLKENEFLKRRIESLTNEARKKYN